MIGMHAILRFNRHGLTTYPRFPFVFLLGYEMALACLTQKAKNGSQSKIIAPYVQPLI